MVLNLRSKEKNASKHIHQPSGEAHFVVLACHVEPIKHYPQVCIHVAVAEAILY